MTLTEKEWREGKKADGTPVVQEGTTAAPRYPIPGTHIPPEKIDGDVDALASKFTRIAAEIAGLQMEALRVRDTARVELDAARAVLKAMSREQIELAIESNKYREITKFFHDELTVRRKWTGVSDAVSMCKKIIEDNETLQTQRDHLKRVYDISVSNLDTTLKDYKELAEAWEKRFGVPFRHSPP